MPTLYISGRETEARLNDRRITLQWLDYKKDDVLDISVPFHDIDRVVLIGMPTVSMPVIYSLLKQGIPIFYMTSHGRWLGSLMPNTNGNATRRMRQHEVENDDIIRVTIAKALVRAKIKNMRRVLQRLASNRSLSHEPEQMDACNSLEMYNRLLDRSIDVESIRGYEGIATAAYFKRLSAFFPPELSFTSRNRHPPRDEANALLSWTYSIVAAEIEAAIRAVGLDPCFGYLHELSTGRPSLAYDLLEPLRAPLCDLLVLNIINHKMVSKNDFHQDSENGGIYLNEGARKIFFHEYEEYMERRFSETKGGVHVTFRRVIRNMVQTICSAIEGGDFKEFFIMP